MLGCQGGGLRWSSQCLLKHRKCSDKAACGELKGQLSKCEHCLLSSALGAAPLRCVWVMRRCIVCDGVQFSAVPASVTPLSLCRVVHARRASSLRRSASQRACDASNRGAGSPAAAWGHRDSKAGRMANKC